MELFFPIVNASVMNVVPDVLLNLNWMCTLIKHIEPDLKTKFWLPSQLLVEIWYEKKRKKPLSVKHDNIPFHSSAQGGFVFETGKN